MALPHYLRAKCLWVLPCTLPGFSCDHKPNHSEMQPILLKLIKPVIITTTQPPPKPRQPHRAHTGIDAVPYQPVLPYLTYVLPPLDQQSNTSFSQDQQSNTSFSQDVTTTTRLSIVSISFVKASSTSESHHTSSSLPYQQAPYYQPKVPLVIPNSLPLHPALQNPTNQEQQQFYVPMCE